jgi:hypothetical protein
MTTSTFRSQAREVGQTQRLLLTLLAESLRKALAVWIEAFLTALLPRSFKLGRGDVPVRPAFLADSTQVLSELFDRGPPEEPVAIVNPVNDKAGRRSNPVPQVRSELAPTAMFAECLHVIRAFCCNAVRLFLAPLRHAGRSDEVRLPG